MSVAYVDTSAAMKLVIDESESAALAQELVMGDHRLVSSWLLHTEMHCAAGRRPDTIRIDAITTVLRRITLADLIRGDLLAAGGHAPLGANDAIHLATAVRLGADEMVTYDQELAQAAEALGLTVVAPH